jgi:transcription initiation factor IIE alpha subunit
MTAKELKRDITCQCEHCKEILRQQERMTKWQKLNSKIERISSVINL